MVDEVGFNPEADLTNDSMPINETEARIYTNDLISFGQWADLYDDNNHIFAHYWLRFAERVGRDDDRQTYIVRIIGQSPLAFLEQVTMPAEMVDDDARVLIMGILDYLGPMGHDGDIISSNDIDDEVGDVHITGFCPEQSARERLQWILTAAGGYALSAFNDVIAINKIPLGSNTSGVLIPVEKTFWKATIKYRDYVSKINVVGYTYTQGTPSNVDEYVTDGTTYWIQQKQVISVSNPSLPSGAPNNEIIIDGLTILTPARASIVASILANYYFNRVEIDVDVINNCEYEPGMKVMVYTDIDAIYGGYISGCDFSFGLQTKSRIHLIGTYGVDVCELTINYMWDNMMVAQRKYYLPKNTPYSITTEYLDKTFSGHRYIFRPTILTVTGTLSSDTTATVPVAIALDHYQGSGSERSTVSSKMTTLLNYYLTAIKADEKAIKKAYKKDKYRKKREKYLSMLEKEKDKTLVAHDAALSKMLEGLSMTEDILHIVSVDEVAEGESGIVDEGKVVVIDDGSSAGDDEYIIVPPDSYTDDPWQGTHDDPEHIYLTSIEVVSQPVKLSYAYGEQLNLAGLSVKAYYSDNTSETVTWACTVSPDDGATLTTAGVQNVTVAYVEEGIRKTTSFQITVAEPQQVKLSSITVSNLPAKTTYDFNDQLDLTGISVTAHYTDNTSATVTNQCIFSPEDGSTLLTLGTQSVLVTYSEDEITRTTSFNITVNEVDETIIPAEAYLRSSISYYSNSVALIVGDRAFSNCSQLVEVDLPNVVSVGTSVFAYCYILSSVNLSNCSYVGNSAFYGCSSIRSLELQKCSSIGDYAFYNCSLMGSIALPECEVIGDRAFVGCDRLTNISIPNCSVIGERAFSGCEGIYSIETSNVTQLGQSAFASCSNLRSINVSKVGVIPNGAFSSCEMLSSVNIIGASVIEKNAFYSCRHLTTIETSDLLHSIGSSAFCFCGSLTSIYIGNTSVIEENAFFDCDDLTTVTTYSQGITSVKANGFEGCWSLADIDTDNLEYVGACGFSNCRSLSASVFPKLQYIGANAFYGCSSLTTLSLPVVSTIGYEAFENCYYLSEVYLTGSSVVSGYSRMFEYTPMKSTSPYGEYGSIYVPSSLVDAYKSASGWIAYSDRIVGI